MPPFPADVIWDLDGPLGRETWVGRPGAYTEVLLDGAGLSLDPALGELPLLRARGSTCVHPGPWPFAFRFCPECGSPLQPAPPPRVAESWSSPGGSGTGLPARSSLGTPDPATRVEVPMPGPARLDWFVAGTPPRLLAFDHTTSRLHAWMDGLADVFESGRWRELLHLPAAAGLPRWSWGVAALADGVAMPGAAGPLFVALGPRSARVQGAEPAVTGCLGGAALVGDTPLLPVSTQDGLAVARWADGAWQLAPVAGGPAEELFAAPSVNATEAFWVGERGQLFMRLSDQGVTCEYRTWRDGWRPMPAVRPVLSPNGVFHQLGRLEGRQSFEALVPPGATPQRRAFDRYVTSGGAVSFIGAARFREPWEPKRMEYRADGNEFLLPLLQLDRERVVVASCSPRTALRSFIEAEPDGEALGCRIMLAGASIVPEDLRMTIRARSAWEIAALVYRRRLLVYELPANRCFSWALRDD